MQKPEFRDLLRRKGFKATPARLALTESLWNEDKPLTVHSIEKKLKARMKRSLNEVTLYRALEALAEKGIIRRVDLGHSHAHYEMEKKHHHHLVCTDCGDVEDVSICPLPQLGHNIGKSSRRFKSIYSHNVEFFGLCKKCA